MRGPLPFLLKRPMTREREEGGAVNAHYPKGADNGPALWPLVAAILLAALLLVGLWIDTYGTTF
jgi:hypothetical protein